MSANPLRKNEIDGELGLSILPAIKIDEDYLIEKGRLFDIQLRGRAITTQCMDRKAEIMKANTLARRTQSSG